jgi:hypothetical protein
MEDVGVFPTLQDAAHQEAPRTAPAIEVERSMIDWPVAVLICVIVVCITAIIIDRNRE